MNSATWIILFFVTVAFLVATLGNNQQNAQVEQWAIANRKLNTFLVFILMGGELYTTFTFLGGSSLVYNKGGIAYYILCYAPIAYILGYWLAPAIWQYAKQNNLVSQADFFIAKYESKTLGLVVSIVGIIALIPYLLLQIKGLGIIVSITSSGLISVDNAIWVSSLILVIYVIIAGMRGSVRVAIIKDILMLTTIIFLGIYLPVHYYGGINAVFAKVELYKPNFTIITNKNLGATWFISTTLISALGLYLWPHGFSSLYTADSAKILRKNAALMPMYQIMLVFIIIIGFVAVLKVPNLDKSQGDLVLLHLVINNFNTWFVGIIGAAGLLTALVPSSVILLATSTLLIKNVYRVFIPNSTIADIKLIKLTVPIIMLLTISANHIGGQTIVSLLIAGYSLVTQLLPALLCSFITQNPVNKVGAIGGILSGISIVLYSGFAKSNTLSLIALHGINIGIIGLILNTLIMFGLSWLWRINK